MISRILRIGVFAFVSVGSIWSTTLFADPKDQSAPAAPAVEADRKLSPNDVIAISVYQEEDLAIKTTIDKKGLVMLPLLGQVSVDGLTASEARQRIQDLYGKDYLVNPQVNLLVEHYAERQYSVMGNVTKPGVYNFPPNRPVNLLEAIATAGGYSRIGSPKAVKVRRKENGQQKVYTLDADKMSKNSKEKPFEIQPDDIIDIPEKVF